MELFNWRRYKLRCLPIIYSSTSMYAGARDVPPVANVPVTARFIHGKNAIPLHSVHAYAPVAA
jgi:hypothetical protein